MTSAALAKARRPRAAQGGAPLVVGESAERNIVEVLHVWPHAVLPDSRPLIQIECHGSDHATTSDSPICFSNAWRTRPMM